MILPSTHEEALQALQRLRGLLGGMELPPSPGGAPVRTVGDASAVMFDTLDKLIRNHGHMVMLRSATEPVRMVVSITCPRCGSVSHHPDDIAQGYCPSCRWWTSDRQLGSPLVLALAEYHGAVEPPPTR